MDKYSYIANAHGSYIEELYRAYLQNAGSVDESWRKFFEGFEFAENYGETNGLSQLSGEITTDQASKEVAVSKLIFAYRSRAHLRSKTNPVRQRKSRNPWLDLELFGLSEADLDTHFQAGNELGIGTATLRKIIDTLKYIYEGTVGFEFTYIREPEVFNWLRDKFEKDALAFNPSLDFKKRILKKLNEAVVFENFLHTKFMGQKRFSLEGGESTIPGLDAIINRASELGVKEVVVGMAHRGRLNVLTNIMGKTYEQIFSEFDGKANPDLTIGDGDVKYHMGFASEVVTPSGNNVKLRLAPNPSHLEVVNSIVQGYCRAQIDEELFDEKYILPILIHGDAALAGQGSVYEVVQMAKLDAYKIGGTIHFVINNQVGFTTDFDEARSSIYSTDIAKMIDAPVLHVNGDDPEAVVFCCQLAVEFRQKFQRDIFIDMVCYRRYGHNETDEPRFTQPKLYNVIASHPSPREVYAQKLVANGSVDASLVQEMDKELRNLLQNLLNEIKQKPLPYNFTQLEKDWQKLRKSTPEDFEQSPETKISMEMVEQIGKALTTLPEGFKTIKQIDKLLEDRKNYFFNVKKLDWACGELLAYGSLLLEEKMVRMSGQDVRRGTFSHRQVVARDAENNQPYFYLDNIVPNQKQPFRIYNSHLSEFGVMGFEFGYSMANPNALVIWEAQFGDFANGAQVIIDQFIAAAESKWQQQNALVLLLPHGYEGQGPEHSSARMERFLQMCAEYNMVVADVTTSANLFHILRRQMAWQFRKPLVIFTPKSLLRAEDVHSPVEEFVNGRFQEVLDDTFVDAKKVKKVLLCTGKMAVDLYREQQKQERKDVAIVRLEQLYPFPAKQLEKVLAKYKKAQIVWVQEEPKNMGAYSFMLMHYGAIECISRKPSASPATGYNKIHNKEQEEIIKKAFEL